jgi:hypothetical protein
MIAWLAFRSAQRQRHLAARFPAAAVSALLLVAGACAGDRDASRSEVRAERQVEAVAWDTVFVIAGGVQDTMLLRPRLLAARHGVLYAYDYGDHRLKAFDATGRPVWQFGGSGAGPEEFGNAIDLEVGADGTVWVADGGNGRLSQVSADGRALRVTPFSGLPVRDVVPLRSGVLVTLVASRADSFWVTLDGAGRPREAGGIPFPELAQAQLAARQGYATLGDDGNTWATVFPFGEPFAVYDGTQVRCAGTLVEAQPFPAQLPPDPRDAVWAVAAVLTDSSLFVLPRGRTEHASRSLDEYSAHDCTYRRTVRLPQRVVAVAWSDGTFHLAVEDPLPAIVGVRLRDGG